MAGLTFTPATVAASGFKKNSLVCILISLATGTPIYPVTWSVSAGSLPAWLSMIQESGGSQMLIYGVVPGALATGASATLTCTDSTPTTPQTGTVTVTTTAVIDGPDPQGFHPTAESQRATLATHDQWRFGLQLGGDITVADALARAWPQDAPTQTS